MKKKIMIDMDDVITHGGFLHLINEFLGTSYKIDDFKDFYMQDMLPDKEDFFKWFLTKNQYDYCEFSYLFYHNYKQTKYIFHHP